ncbi:MAG: insulinase family protein [Pirellulales bacterium]|nr:insulinase family protein [Pirellulales bacterium]
MEFLKHKLANGLEVVAEVSGDAYSTALGFFVRAGARDESDDVAGVSHFLEHMMFKGTPTRSADDVNREFDEMGAHYNAFTSEEATVYYAAVLPEHQTDAVSLLADMLRPSLRKDDFDTEKQVIIEEIRMYDDQPPFGADDKCKAVYFGKHPLGRSVLGTVGSITDLSVESMRAYFERRYSPHNIVLVGAGRIDFDEFIATADRLCGGWQDVSADRPNVSVSPSPSFHVFHKPSSTQQYTLSMSPAPAAIDAQRFAAKLLAVMVGDDSGSRLFWEFVDPGLAEQASLSHYDYQDVGAFLSYMSCDPERAEVNLRQMAELFRRIDRDGFTVAELEQAKRKTSSRVVLGSERPRGRLFTVGSNWVQRREHRTVLDDIEAVAAVTLDDVHALLKAYPLSKTTTVTIGPLETLGSPN